jgi:phosphatidylglycerol:prolipoprotein diacylglycerol transferase
MHGTGVCPRQTGSKEIRIMNYITWNISPEALTLPFFNIPVRWYGIFFALAFLAGTQLMSYFFKKEHKPSKHVDMLTLYVILGAVAGARLGHFIFYNPAKFMEDPMEIILPPYAGLASHGAAIGILTGAWLFCYKYNYGFLWLLDRLAIIVALGGGLIRLGNLMNSEIIGSPSSVPWAFIFTSVDQVPRHPAQLYEALNCFVLFAVILFIWYKKRDRLKNGFIFSIFLIQIFGFRFLDEFFKENQENFEAHLPMNMGQFLSIPFVILGLVLLWITIQRKKIMEES